MKKTILTLLIMLSPVFAFAGDNIYVGSTNIINTYANNDSDEHVFDVVDKMPSFPGGEEALLAYLHNFIKYPVAAASKGIQGRVTVNFLVEKDGSITNTTVIKSADPSLDQEALRVINTMNKWIPGKNNGRNVRVRYTVPIIFRFNSKDSNNDSDEHIYDIVEQMPTFPGGDHALLAYLRKSVKYPAESEAFGQVIVRFAVRKDGSITNAFVIKSIDPYLDQEALRVVNNMPKWNPGKQQGQNVEVNFVVPVTFILPRRDSNE